MGFSLDLEEPKKEEIVQALQVQPEVADQLTVMARNKVTELMTVDVNSLTSRREITAVIDGFGKEVVERSKAKNSLLDTRMVDLSKTGSEGGVVVKSLNDLNQQMQVLDPSGLDFTRTGILGKIFNPMREYFAKYEKADAVITDIFTKLDKGRKTLVNDNTTLECEQQAIRQITDTLGKQVELGTKMDECLEQEISKLHAMGTEEDKAKFLEEEVLFPLRQRTMDLQQMQAVNMQSYFAMEVVRKNNKELIRAVDRSKTVTQTVLRTAVMLASALYNQKIVLDCVTKLNQTTNDMIGAVGKMLKTQGTEIQKQAMETSVSPEVLRQAFVDTFEAMDALDTYKQEALPRMKQTLLEFHDMAIEGEKRIQKIEAGFSVS